MPWSPKPIISGSGGTAPTSLDSLADIDLTTFIPSGNDVLTYDEIRGKWISKPVAKPSLSELTDIDFTGTTPSDNYVLTYNQSTSKWAAKAPAVVGSGGTSSIDASESYSLVSGGSVSLKSPYAIKNLIYDSISASSINLSWSASESTDIQDYVIYNNGSQVGTTTSTNYSVTGLSTETTYVLTVKSRNTSQILSEGVSTTVKTYGSTVFTSHNTSPITSVLVQSSSTGFDYIEADINIVSAKSSWANCIATFTGYQNKEIYYQFNGTQVYYDTALISQLYVNGVAKASNSANTIPDSTNVTLGMQMVQTFTGNVYVIGDGTTASNAKLYAVRLYKNDDYNVSQLVSYYDFTHSGNVSSVPDLLGNNGNTLLSNGTYQ